MNISKTWQRLPGENEKAWVAFSNYLHLPPPRTFLAAYLATYPRPSGKRPVDGSAPTWFRAWAKTYQWQERAKARDAFLDSKREAGEAKGVECSAIRWAEERERLRKRELELGNRLCDEVMKLLTDLPIDTEATLKPRDLAALATALVKGAELVRNAAEYPVAREPRLPGPESDELKQTLTVIVQYDDPEPCGEDAPSLQGIT